MSCAVLRPLAARTLLSLFAMGAGPSDRNEEVSASVVGLRRRRPHAELAAPAEPVLRPGGRGVALWYEANAVNVVLCYAGEATYACTCCDAQHTMALRAVCHLIVVLHVASCFVHAVAFSARLAVPVSERQGGAAMQRRSAFVALADGRVRAALVL